jgi:glutaminyl-peptide cyclotransferase
MKKPNSAAIGVFFLLLLSSLAFSSSVSQTRIAGYFKELMDLSPRPAGSAKLQKCRRFLINTLKTLSLDVREEVFTAQTPKGPVPMANVIAEKKGQSDRIIYLGSHIDTKHIDGMEILGANDSGSSTAALLELARVLSDRETKFTYRFAFFDGEESILENMTETDGLYGSLFHVRKLIEDKKRANVSAMILLDMIGDKDLVVFRDYNSSSDLFKLFASCCRQLGFGRIATGPGTYMYDDHVPFLQAGIPALDIIDFDYGPDNSHWHTAKDTAENVSIESIFKITQAVLCMLESLESQ